MNTAAQKSPRSRLVRSVGLWVLAALPGLLALVPGVAIPLWNLVGPAQSAQLSHSRVIWLVAVLVISLLWIPAALLPVAVARLRGRTLAEGFRVAVAWELPVGALALVAVSATTGGL